MKSAFLLLLLGAAAMAGDLPPGAPADGDGRFIVDDEAYEAQSAEAAERLAKEGRLVNYTDIARKAPADHPALAVASVSTQALSPAELAEKLRKSTVAVGLRYLDPKKRGAKNPSGKPWSYMIGATAFAVAPGVLSTSLHVMTLDPSFMKEAQAVAVTCDGTVHPITGVIAASDRADTCLVSVPGLDLPPLPIRPGVKTGEPVWCMSHPDGFTYMFTGGQVARVSRGRWDGKHGTALHVEVTAEYCPGSSGGALADSAGNVVAQVSSINNYEGMDDADGRSVNGIVSARTCTAAEEILALTRP
ncbi:MAG: serine protease, partial [Planctomycetia bacterium]|nr:serine protease [Planctomycetia bacterium]